MQKGGRITYVKDKWVGSHPASIQEAKALEYLKFKPNNPEINVMNCGVYKNIHINYNNDYNDSIYNLYNKLKPHIQKKVIKCFEEAYRLRIEQNKKFENPTPGHEYYPAIMSTGTHSLKSSLVGSPKNRIGTEIGIRKNLNAPRRYKKTLKIIKSIFPNSTTIRSLNFQNQDLEYQNALTELISNLQIDIDYQTNYSNNAGNKFKKTRKRKRKRKSLEKSKKSKKK